MMTRRAMRNTAIFSILVLATPAIAQTPPDLICGGQQTVSYIGQTVREFKIPTVNPPQFLWLSIEGADGGDAEAGNNNQCQSRGGHGAIATALFAVGFDPGQLEPGGTIRFIIGEAGENADRNSNTGPAAGSGGGGSAVLYLRSDDDLAAESEILLVGGAGGGAYRQVSLGICGGDHDGNDGVTDDECGSDGSNGPGSEPEGGCGGNAGEDGIDGGGGGGGAFRDEGTAAGGNRGFHSGGSGGGGTHQGGWGFGGGGASVDEDEDGDRETGGGGGYSGGGAGRRRGGGSYINEFNFIAFGEVTRGNNSPSNGKGFYECIDDNDDCANAFVIQDSPNGILPSASGIIGTPNSTDGSSSCESPPKPDRWYAYTATCDSTVTVRVDNSFQFNLAAFDACGGNELACDLGKILPPQHMAEITWSVLAGQNYLIRVSNSGPVAQ